MKNFTNLISFCFITLFLVSCGTRAAYLARQESSSFSSSGISLAPTASKSAHTSKAAAAANSALLRASNTTSTSGFLIGIYFTDLSLSEDFELQPEIDFLLVKDLNEIQAPILVKYNVADAFSLLAGPNLGFLLDAPNGLKSFNFGIDFGAAYDIGEKFNVNARYDLGLTNLLKNPGGNSVKLRGIQVGVGYKF
ncbi:outer membrane beta-barrel protein [Hwangdonia lutea]|uniref:Outer membrane beta-barrel protein n=1 Tax=Hwangdonia lutea TaxID=3075823 RepID=A0AA97HQ95_9FLAO|nr:outer membrane beta-barrel protein [Hwangdonia sp. SCSIO 19198]WOD43397.1 outer membrane beta-barrel protein [Hwangdonia sp. SCSIO 19198]